MTSTPLSGRIITVGSDELDWPFRYSPTVLIRHPEIREPTSVTVDPFPCYPHDATLVADCAAAVEAAFPIGFSPRYYLLSNEDDGRTNGHANREMIWREGGEKPTPWAPYIVLAGKRIPIHPAVTHYLVPHEYGHVVQWWIEYKMGREEHGVVTQLRRDYAALRGIEVNGRYGGRQWHLAPGELFANDFRVLVAKAEPEFWPHPGIARPEEVPAVVDFWAEAVEKYAYKPTDRPAVATL